MNKKQPDVRFPGFSSDWEERKCKDIFDKVAHQVDVKSEEVYREIGIRSHGKGIFYKDEITGKQIGNKRVFWVEPDCFIVNIVFAWERAVAKTTEKEIGMIASHRFPMYKPKKDEVDLNYITKFFTTDKGKYILEMASPGGAGRNRTLGKKEFDESSFFLPSFDEQKKIGSYLDALDHYIDLHEHQYEHLRELKQACLQQMFPRPNETRPKTRFPGFTDDWEQRKFGEVFTSLQNNTLSRAELSNEPGAAQSIHYGDVLIKYDEVLNVSDEPLAYIANQSVADKFRNSYLQNGDIVIADTAEDETVGKCTEIKGLTDQKIVSGLHTIPVRANKEFASGFLGFYLNSGSYHDQLRPLMQGIKVTSISKGALQDTIVKYPSDLKEQASIGNFFESLDNFITLHQRKLNHLKELKQGLLQKMFV